MSNSLPLSIADADQVKADLEAVLAEVQCHKHSIEWLLQQFEIIGPRALHPDTLNDAEFCAVATALTACRFALAAAELEFPEPQRLPVPSLN